MIGVTELRSGTIFEENGNLLRVLSYEHIKMGRGSANIKVKVKNLRNGSVVEKGFINGAKVNDVSVIKRDLQYLYRDSDFAYFMDPKSFEQVSVPMKTTASDVFYLKEGETFNISFSGQEALAINFPPKMIFKVEETPPGVKGNSVTNVFKEAKLENGMSVKVPLFIKIGEYIKVDTRTGAYSEKAQINEK